MSTTTVATRKSVLRETDVQSATGAAVPAGIPDGDVVILSTIHSFHISLGWRWVIANHFLVRMSLGYLQSVGSSSHLELPASLASNATVASRLGAANQIIDSKLSDLYTTS